VGNWGLLAKKRWGRGRCTFTIDSTRMQKLAILDMFFGVALLPFSPSRYQPSPHHHPPRTMHDRVHMAISSVYPAVAVHQKIPIKEKKVVRSTDDSIVLMFLEGFMNTNNLHSNILDIDIEGTF